MQPTLGCIKRMLSGESLIKPVVQILGHKKIPGGGTNERYRFIISDQEVHYPFCMLATKYNDQIQNGEIDKYALIQLDNYVCNQLQPDKKVLVITEITILAKGSEVGRLIGNPTSLVLSSNATAALDPAAGRPSAAEPAGSPGAINSALRVASRRGNGSTTANFARGPGGNRNANMPVFPIVSLSPFQNRWTILARVTNKSAIRTWSNSRGEGKLFSMDLLDESGEIRATAFNDQCDKFYNLIEPGQVYYISKATLKAANKQFTSIKNDYEMSFTPETEVEPCYNAPADLPSINFNFTPINEIENVGTGMIVDVIGVCKAANEVQNVVSKNTQQELKKRDITLLDRSNTEITLTLWGDKAEKFDGDSNPIVVAKGVKVSDFGGKTLSAVGSTLIQINPDIDEANLLRGWYDREGTSLQTQSLSAKTTGKGIGGGNLKTLAQAKGEMLGHGEKADYYTTKAMVVKIREDNCLYMACPSENCNKKVIDMNNGAYRCERCAREYTDFKWRLILSVNIVDFSEEQWITCFQEPAEAILGKTAQEIGMIRQTDEKEFRQIICNAMFRSFIFRLRVKLEEFKEESRLKTVVMQAIPMNYVEYGEKLLQDIKRLQTVL